MSQKLQAVHPRATLPLKRPARSACVSGVQAVKSLVNVYALRNNGAPHRAVTCRPTWAAIWSRWATVQSIGRRLELHNQDLIDRAIIHAYECGWIDIQGLHSVKLTNECRLFFVKALKR